MAISGRVSSHAKGVSCSPRAEEQFLPRIPLNAARLESVVGTTCLDLLQAGATYHSALCTGDVLFRVIYVEFDDTPDVPFRTSDLYVTTVLDKAAALRGIPHAELVDGILAQAWGADAGWNLDVQRLDRLAAQFGLPPARRLSAVAKSREELKNLPASLRHREGDLTLTIEDANRRSFRSFLAARSDWRAMLEPAALKALDPVSRMALGRRLTAELAVFSGGGGDEEARAAKLERDALKSLTFRTIIRMAALSRMGIMLDVIAGWSYLADRPAERRLAQRLVDCEALDLKLPEAVWVDPGPALPAWDDDMALVQTLFAKPQNATDRPALPSWSWSRTGASCRRSARGNPCCSSSGPPGARRARPWCPSSWPWRGSATWRSWPSPTTAKPTWSASSPFPVSSRRRLPEISAVSSWLASACASCPPSYCSMVRAGWRAR